MFRISVGKKKCLNISMKIMDKFTKDQIELSKLTKRLILVPFGQSFRFCNNSCEFCYLKDYMKSKPLTIDQCKRIAENTYNWTKHIINELPEDVFISLEIIGGELFIMPDEYYDIYYNLIYKLNNMLSNHNRMFEVLLISNLILNENRLKKLETLYLNIKNLGIDVNITTSFDLWGRFKNDLDLELWYNNLESLSSNIQLDIEVILSDPSIQKYLKEDNSKEVLYFKKLLDQGRKYNICFNEFIPNSNETIKYVPSNTTLIQFYKKLIDNYWNKITELDNFKVSDINISPDYVKSTSYCAECAGPVFGLPNETDHGFDFDYEEFGIYKTYCAETGLLSPWKQSDHILRKDLYKVSVPIDEWVCLKYPEVVNNYFDKVLKCTSCKFRNSCYNNRQQECYIMHQFKWKEDKCWKKEVFAYIEDKGLIDE